MKAITKRQLTLAHQRMERNPFLHRGVVKRWFYNQRQDDDLLQVARLGVWKAALTCRESRPFVPYAMVCARNELVNYIRQEARQREACAAALQCQTKGDWLAPSADYESLRLAVRHRWPGGGDKATILLSLADGVSVQQLANQLGCSRYRVKELARRGVRELGLG